MENKIANMKPYMPVVIELLNKIKPKSILDAPSGGGWLPSLLETNAVIDGVDLFEGKSSGYRNIIKSDLEYGIPNELEKYDVIVSCEGLEHIGNPRLFLETARQHLQENGTIIITTPNVWYVRARIQYLMRGFHPGFPCLTGKICRGTHMHITPWSFPQLYLYLVLTNYTDITLHDTVEKKPKYFFERIIGMPQKLYCRHKLNKTTTIVEKKFWQNAANDQSIFGTRLVVSATNRKNSR